jgi:hypothetical protein
VEKTFRYLSGKNFLIPPIFREQRRFLLIAAKAAKPSEADLETLLKPTAEVIGNIQNFR